MRFSRRCIGCALVAIVTETAIHEATKRRQMRSATVSLSIPRPKLPSSSVHKYNEHSGVSPFAEGSPASDRKAPIIIHSSLNRPPTRQLRLPVSRSIPCILTTRFHNACVCYYVLTFVPGYHKLREATFLNYVSASIKYLPIDYILHYT